MTSAISYIDDIETLNKIVKLTKIAWKDYGKTAAEESSYQSILNETIQRVNTLLKNASNDLDKQQLKQLGDELLRMQKVRYEQSLIQS